MEVAVGLEVVALESLLPECRDGKVDEDVVASFSTLSETGIDEAVLSFPCTGAEVSCEVVQSTDLTNSLGTTCPE